MDASFKKGRSIPVAPPKRGVVIDQHPSSAPLTPEDIVIGDRAIGIGHPPFIIAEVGLEHSGSLERALDFIQLVANLGADAIKFQTHIATAESSPEEGFRGTGRSSESRTAYWERTAFSPDSWKALRDRSEESGLVFLSSPFSVEAVDLLESLDIAAWKIPSGEFRSVQLLEAVTRTSKPILLSTGMSTWAEIDFAMNLFREAKRSVICLQSTSKYPTPLNEVGLNILPQLASRYRCHVGLSDHSGSPWASIAGMALGACVIEVHINTGTSDSPDGSVLLSQDDFSLIVDAATSLQKLSVHVDKDTLAASLGAERNTYAKSLALKVSCKRGAKVALDLLTERKPGGGIDPREARALIGRTLSHDVPMNTVLKWTDFNE